MARTEMYIAFWALMIFAELNKDNDSSIVYTCMAVVALIAYLILFLIYKDK